MNYEILLELFTCNMFHLQTYATSENKVSSGSP